MIIDAATLGPDCVLDCDVCVVGSGAAGTTIACELDQARLDVILLESGGEKYVAKQQEALKGAVEDGSPHSPPHMYRRRMLGGATTIWGGRCIPLSPVDLEARSYVPHSGWPIGWDELSRYYRKAQDYCEAGAPFYTVQAALGPDAPATIQGFDDADVTTCEIERYSLPTNFGRARLPSLAASRNVRVLLNVTVTSVDPDGRAVSSIVAERPDGGRVLIRARHYVLAMGGIETPRLLMNSDPTTRGGLGNEGGALGRFYMCHIENTLGLLRLNPASRRTVVKFERTPDSVYVRRKLSLSAEVQKREGLLNTTARLHHPLISDPSHLDGVLSAMYLVKDTILPEYRRKLAVIEQAGRDRIRRDARFWSSHIANVGLNSAGVIRFGVGWLRHRTLAKRKLPSVVLESRTGAYPLDVNAEQIPDPGNRILLDGAVGPDKLRQVKVAWRMTDQDTDSLVRSMRVIQESFARSGCGTFELDDDTLLDQVRMSSPIGGHHIGTTRMGDDPGSSVVDRHCRVHSLGNLHIAGAAVFPTCGHANPTLTIVALSIRLAERLKATLESRPELA